MYRITGSIIGNLPEVAEAFRARGIRDYCNAHIPGHIPIPTQVFVMDDGSVVPSDGQVVSEIARQLEQREAA